MAVIELQVNQFFPMIQNDPTSNPYGLFASNFLNLLEKVRTNKQFAKTKNTLTINQYVQVRKAIANLLITQHIEFSQDGGKGESKVVTEFFHMWQKAKVVLFNPVKQTITFVQSTDVYKNHPGVHVLTIEQLVHMNISRMMRTSQTLSITSKASGFLLNPNYISGDSPTLGGPNGTPSYVF